MGKSVLRWVEDPGQKEPRRHDHATEASKPLAPNTERKNLSFANIHTDTISARYKLRQQVADQKNPEFVWLFWI